jgi:Pyridoxamine 5'-phosphate oxidase
MGKVYEAIEGKLADWIERQRLFFVGTAPLADDGHINVSPKGDLRSFRIVGPREVAYLDLVGSGAETIAHLRENGRIVIMFCAFDGPPRIVRLHGRGRALLPGEPGFDALLERFDPPDHGLRTLISVRVDRVADSCGYGVPLMEFRGIRPQQDDWTERMVAKGPGALEAYVAEKNALSIDGLPAIDPEPVEVRRAS